MNFAVVSEPAAQQISSLANFTGVRGHVSSIKGLGGGRISFTVGIDWEESEKRERKRDVFVIHKGMFWILLLYSQFVVEIEGIILSGQMWNGGTKTIFDLISGKIRQIALPSNSRFSSMIELCYFFSLFLSLRPGYIVMRNQFFKYNLAFEYLSHWKRMIVRMN